MSCQICHRLLCICSRTYGLHPLEDDSRDATIAELRSALSIAQLNERRYKAAIDSHNSELDSMCGLGDQEGVACKYRPYFPRRCPDCPKHHKIDEEYIAIANSGGK